MKIVELTDEYRPLFLVCLEDWSEDMKDAGCRKERWCRAKEGKGLASGLRSTRMAGPAA